MNGSINRRDFLRVSAATTAGLTLAGCGIGGGSSGTTLTVWGFTGVIEGVQGQVKAFERKHKDVDLKVKIFGYEDIHTNLLNAIVSGNGAPDLCSIDVLRLTQYVHGLTPLNEERATYASQFVPPVISLGSYRGNFYGLVTDSEPMGMLYRKDLWDQYGIKESDIKIWDDLAVAGDKVFKASGGKVYLYSIAANEASLYEVLAVQQGFGGYYFDYSDKKVIVDDPKIVAAMTVLKHLWDSKGCQHNPNGGYAGDEMTVLLKKGKVASQIVGPAWYPQTLTQNMPDLKGKWRLMRVPAIESGGPRVGYQYPTIFVIPKQTSEKKLAWSMELMGLTNKGAVILFTKDHVLPAWNPLLNKLIPADDPYFSGQKTFALWQAIAQDCPRITFGTGFTEAQAILSKHQGDIFNGKVSPEAGMKAAAQEMRSKLKKA